MAEQNSPQQFAQQEVTMRALDWPTAIRTLVTVALGGIGAAAGFTHTHDWASAHGQHGWLAWADAVVIEGMAVVAGFEIHRDHTTHRPTRRITLPQLVLVAAFILYGLSYGMAEGTQRALVADFAPAEIKATVLGAYHTSIGIVRLASGVVAGLLWVVFMPQATFAFGAIAATVATIGLVLWKPPARS